MHNYLSLISYVSEIQNQTPSHMNKPKEPMRLSGDSAFRKLLDYVQKLAFMLPRFLLPYQSDHGTVIRAPTLNHSIQQLQPPQCSSSHYNRRSKALLGESLEAEAQNFRPHPSGALNPSPASSQCQKNPPQNRIKAKPNPNKREFRSHTRSSPSDPAADADQPTSASHCHARQSTNVRRRRRNGMKGRMKADELTGTDASVRRADLPASRRRLEREARRRR